MRLQAGQPVRPYAMHYVQAGNPVRLEITSLDFDNSREAPTFLQYRIDNLTDIVVIQEWTEIPTPAETTTLTIAGSVNQMTWPYRDTQLNQVTILASYADGSQAQMNACYQLNALYTANFGPAPPLTP